MMILKKEDELTFKFFLKPFFIELVSFYFFNFQCDMISLKSTRLFQSKFKASINQTRNYRSEAGNTWKRFEYEDEELKKYVFSFKSKGLSYYLLGIVPYHPRSKELIEKV